MLAQLDLNEIQREANRGGTSFDFSQSLGDVFSTLLVPIFTIAGILLLIYLLFGGFQLMTSGGDPKAVEGAKGKITNALIGFVIVFTAFWIVQILGNLLGLPKITNIFQ